MAVLSSPRFPTHASRICCKGIKMRYSTLACHAISSPSELPGRHICTVSAWWCLSFSYCHSCCQDLGPIGMNSQQWMSRTWPQLCGVAPLSSVCQGPWRHIAHALQQSMRAKTKLLLHLALLQHWPIYSITYPRAATTKDQLVFAASVLICSLTLNPFSLFLLSEGLPTQTTASGVDWR